jgi:probable rRNA maturation factor
LAVTVTTPDSGRVSARGLGSWLVKAAPAKASGEVTVALISDARMRTLNRVFRGKDYATDVLSFPMTDQPRERGGGVTAPSHQPQSNDRYLGDIVIATGVAARQADGAGHPIGTELKILALHGLLHLLGYDHETDDGLMARTERRLRTSAGLSEGLIERDRPKPGHTQHVARSKPGRMRPRP